MFPVTLSNWNDTHTSTSIIPPENAILTNVDVRGDGSANRKKTDGANTTIVFMTDDFARTGGFQQLGLFVILFAMTFRTFINLSGPGFTSSSLLQIDHG
jgi:hypothetical protein